MRYGRVINFKLARSLRSFSSNKNDSKSTCSPTNMEGATGSSDICIYRPPPSAELKECKPIRPSPEAIPPEHLPLPPMYPQKVIVVGAGLSGLSAAARLIKHGVVNTTILEASSRPGGRLLSAYMGDGAFVELGATTIEKTVNIPEVLSSQISSSLAKSLLTNKELSRPIALYALNEFKKMEDEIQALKKEFEGGDALRTFVGIKMQQAIKKLPKEYSEMALRVLTALSINIIEPVIESDSVANFVVAPDGSKIPLGSIGMISSELDEIGPNKIVYNKRVSKVRWGTVTEGVSPRAIVHCNDGTTYGADYVIVAVPSGVLKAESQSMFSPQLPSVKNNAIESIQFRCLEKVFIKWSIPFWVWRDCPYNGTWTPEEMECRDDWTKGLVSVKEYSGDKYALIQAVVLGREPCTQLCRSSDDEVITTFLKFMNEWRGGGEENATPTPQAIIRSRWTIDSNFNGGSLISNPSKPVSPAEHRTLKEPVPLDGNGAPIIFFAGEATVPCPIYGSYTGARVSGQREADLVFKWIQATMRGELVAAAGSRADMLIEKEHPCLQKCCVYAGVPPY